MSAPMHPAIARMLADMFGPQQGPAEPTFEGRTVAEHHTRVSVARGAENAAWDAYRTAARTHGEDATVAQDARAAWSRRQAALASVEVDLYYAKMAAFDDLETRSVA